jgi:hypothetical protein
MLVRAHPGLAHGLDNSWSETASQISVVCFSSRGIIGTHVTVNIPEFSNDLCSIALHSLKRFEELTDTISADNRVPNCTVDTPDTPY